MKIDKKIKKLKNEIRILNNKVNKEKQVNIQCDLHKELLKKEKELESLEIQVNK